MKRLTNNKGVILLATYFVILVIAVLSAAFFMQVITETRSVQRNKASLEAFYAAQAGLNFGYTECFLSGWTWRTHNWNGNFTAADQNANLTLSLANLGARTDTDVDGFYTIPGYNFRLRAYPEVDWNKVAQGDPSPFTGIIILHAQGQDAQGLVTRTLELRISQMSMYEYFYFYPESHTFGSAIYDGAGYGKIHANGNITFYTDPVFKNLSELSAGDAFEGGYYAHNGYLDYYRWQYTAPYQFDGNYDGQASQPQASYPPYSYYTPSDWYWSDYHWNYSYKGKINGTDLPRTLHSGEDYQWDYDKYSGGNPANEKPVKFVVDNGVLSWLACAERGGDHAANPSYYLLNATEQAQFNANPGAFDWAVWKTANPDYEQKFWRAQYNLKNSGNWVADAPSWVNHEWWDDLTYGNDRSSGDLKPAKSESADPAHPDYAGYFLNTQEQAQAWQDYLNGKQVTITKADTRETVTLDLSSVVKEVNSGGEYITPMRLEVNYKEKAQNGGIYIGKTETKEYKNWQAKLDALYNQENAIYEAMWNELEPYWEQFMNGEISWDELIAIWEGIRLKYEPQLVAIEQKIEQLYAHRPNRYEWENSIADVCKDEHFINNTRPAGTYEYYWNGSLWDKFPNPPQPTQVLTIDVAALKEKIDAEGLDFNGIIYVENEDEQELYYKDFSVRLINAGVLPEQGLTLVTPHNIYVQGNFNLCGTLPDGETDPKKARDYQAIQNYKTYHPDAPTNQDDYLWHQAALISTSRLIYTLSEDFNDPQQFPVAYDYWNKATRNYYPYCLSDQTFLDTYAPAPNSSQLPQLVKNFFTQHPEVTPPAQWTWSWINDNMTTTKYPEAADVQRALLDAGNAKYQTTNEALFANRVLKDTTYNTAMVSPYNPEGYTLERWSGKIRNITGAFIQLEAAIQYDKNWKQIAGCAWVPLARWVNDYNPQSNTYTYYYSVTGGYQYPNGYQGHPDYRGYYQYAYYWHGSTLTDPARRNNYEINFAGAEQTSADFLGGALGSWREIVPGEF